MKKLAEIGAILLACLVMGAIAAAINPFELNAATQTTYKWERELGRQKLTPTSSTALTLPNGTTHAEFYVEGGDLLVNWSGGAPVDNSTGAMKWPAGHFRKEENDGPKLSLFRAKCASCTLWVNYFADRRAGS